jgi:hypothetical protein
MLISTGDHRSEHPDGRLGTFIIIFILEEFELIWVAAAILIILKLILDLL